MAKKNTENEDKIINIADKLPEENATPKAKRTRKKKVAPAEVTETNHGVELSEFEQSIISADEKKIEYVLEPRTREGADIHVKVAQSLPVAYLMQLMRDVIHVYFPDGVYDPFFGHNVIEMVLFEAYTQLTFHDDVDVYNKFKSLYCYWPSGIELDVTSILPVEAHQFMSAVDDKVEQLCKLYFAPVELAQLLDACRSFVDRAGNAIENVENVLDAFVKQTEKDGVPLKDMVDALRKVGSHEEKAAARAVLDFQLEKAKKDAEKKAEVIKE